MIKTIHADVETRSPVDLRKQGAFVYFEHPDTTVLMMAYRLDDQPIRMWTYDQPCPDDLRAALEGNATIVAYNSQFETLAFDLLADRKGWPRVSYDRYIDTAAAASAMGLPRSLGDLAEALGLPIQKDKEGSRLIRLFSLPRRPKKGEDPDGLYWHEPEDHPEDWEKFKRYCVRDVETEEAAAERLVPLSDFEQKVWLLDQKINRRGVRCDVRSAIAATNLAEKAKKTLDREMRIVTGGYVPACSNPGKLVEWVQAQGVSLDSAAKAEITSLLDTDDLPENVRKALEIRQEAAKTSVAKLTSMVARASADGRIRGGFIYHGAGTGRWVSTGVNLANLPRPRRVYEDGKPRTDLLFEVFRQEDPDLLGFLYGPELGRPLHLISDAIRGFIWSAPGHELMQADYSGIEGAVIAWLANEVWKLEALHAIAADPSLPDMYRRTAANIMNMTVEEITKKHPFRQSIGKTSELALGFQGSVSAFYTMARNYGVDLNAVYAPVWENADEEQREKSERRFINAEKRGIETARMLGREAYIACDIVKDGWRRSNSAIAGSWRASENAAREAIENPGRVTEAARSQFKVAQGFLWMKLPSGRCLAFGSPKLSDQVWAKVKLPDGSWSESEVMLRETAEAGERRGDFKIEGSTSPKITILTTDSQTRKFRRRPTYGGDLMQSATQATARDLLVNGMIKAEEHGYSVIGHVYDELICEVPQGFGDLGFFEKLICRLPDWAAGLPLTAEGYRAKRYHK